MRKSEEKERTTDLPHMWDSNRKPQMDKPDSKQRGLAATENVVAAGGGGGGGGAGRRG